MTRAFKLPASKGAEDDGLITLAILAVGGQGGGVLTDWLVEIAEANGYRAQSTSVPGLAQRTGATLYYIEMLPDTGRAPVFALMPAAGDVDIVVACEIMEAGRAVDRGFVTASQTALITSSHRIYVTSEKIAPGDGRADKGSVVQRIRDARPRRRGAGGGHFHHSFVCRTGPVRSRHCNAPEPCHPACGSRRPLKHDV